MREKLKWDHADKLYRAAVFLGIIVLALNLRPAITSVGPLIGIIRDDIGLSNWSAGMLTSLPLIAFAVMSPIVPWLRHRLSNEWAMLVGLFLLSGGIGIRSMPLAWLLFAGTLLIGFGIAVLNVLIPSVIKEKFPLRVGLMTSIYSTAMGVLAALASGLSVPIASNLHLGWEAALFVWILPAVVGVGIWVYLALKRDKNNSVAIAGHHSQANAGNQQIMRSPLAWQVALFMGMQSMLFYVSIAWLPEILLDYGVSKATAGWMLSFTQFIGLPASFLVPVIAEKSSSQRRIVFVLTICAIGGYSGLLLGSSYTTMVVSVIFIGISLAGNFALALTFLSMRARNAKQAAELSGMAQSLGYILAAVGPILIGYMFDFTEAWTVPLLTIMGVSLLVLFFWYWSWPE
ncbi:MFS transporter [Virgibacillus halophilus]|uniref:MFS transporter n=1 Tax=Tigheibacillus halophilus TaxID=361280 RepID=A0ABU5C1V2_9BACI|nr:MFS transporter [Virgibacillus halophilus]